MGLVLDASGLFSPAPVVELPRWEPCPDVPVVLLPDMMGSSDCPEP